MWAKIGTFLLDYLRKRLESWLAAVIRVQKKRADQDKKAEKQATEYQAEVEKPEQTREERRRAEDTFLNS